MLTKNQKVAKKIAIMREIKEVENLPWPTNLNARYDHFDRVFAEVHYLNEEIKALDEEYGIDPKFLGNWA